MNPETAKPDLEKMRERFLSGEEYWRSLEELSQTPEFRAFLEKEFPEEASVWDDGVSRRDFLKVMGAALALAGLSACSPQPLEKIVPYVKSPEEVVPGKPLYFATAMSLSGLARGILVESHLGRPTKIEGNPEHPDSLGATDVFMQASVLELYDPDRAKVLTHRGMITTWDHFLADLKRHLAPGGAGFRILTEAVTSPTLANQMKQFLEKYPEARWHQFEPWNRDNVREGSLAAFGEAVLPEYRFEGADVVVSLDGDFLFSEPSGLRYARAFTRKRNAAKGADKMNRLYAAESSVTMTGAMADERIALPPSRIASLVLAMLRECGIISGIYLSEQWTDRESAWIKAAAADLKKQRGRGLVLCGSQMPPFVHAAVHALNAALGNAGKTVVYRSVPDTLPGTHLDSLRELLREIESGKVTGLMILGGNPAYSAPEDLRFAEHLGRIPFRAHLSLHVNETSKLCPWNIPQAHFLEAWGDGRSADGTATITQPLIQPLYGGRSANELLSVLSGDAGKAGYDILRDYWKRTAGSGGFEKTWRKALHDGVVPGTVFPERSVSVKGDLNLAGLFKQAAAGRGDGLEAVFRPDPSIWDGRFSNNAWLQELPKPFTKLTWDNAALVSVGTAKRLQLKNGDIVEISAHGRSVQAPVWIQPGHSDGCVTLPLGYGRAAAGRVGNGLGFDANRIRSSAAFWNTEVEIKKTGKRTDLACAQDHQSMENRHLVRAATKEKFAHHPDFAQHMTHEPKQDETLYGKKPPASDEYQWGMVINLGTCIGCNACVTACQAENNIPTVGKEQVKRGREMHWIRIDQYYKGSPEDPEMLHQPVTCMHCENAPCEPVCPVGATVHSKEGLNEMVYNRCVGTRYCGNNCPYKVRRFNFLEYNDNTAATLKMLRNPDVTVRMRGVMEKCTYCVQRINQARINSKKEGRLIKDGEVVTACQSACPAEAITFGNILDPESAVSKLRATPLNYGLLTDLNTKPRTTYLAKVTNPAV